MQLRAPFEEKQTKIANGTMLEVGKITPDAITLTTDKGKIVNLDTERSHAIDYGYAAASQNSPGKTIDRVLIHAEAGESVKTLDEKMADVAVSRTRDEALIFTDDAAKLAGRMAREIERTEITPAKVQAVEHASERVAAVAADTKSEIKNDERVEIKRFAAKSPTAEDQINAARKTNSVLEPKPEVKTVARGEVKSPVVLSKAQVLPGAKIQLSAQPQKTPADGDARSIDNKLQLIEEEFKALRLAHRQAVAESRTDDFQSVHTDASRYADILTTRQRDKNKSLTPENLSKIWKNNYRENYQTRWDDNRTQRVNRRRDEIRVAIAIDARFTAAARTVNGGSEIIARRTSLSQIEAVPVEQKAVLVMQHIREAHLEWKEFQDAAQTPPPAPKNERVMRFFIEHDARTAPTADTLDTALEITRLNQMESLQFKSELDAKVWVMTNLPAVGKQMFLENCLEQAEKNQAAQLAEMQKIQLNESYRMIVQQTARTNQELTAAAMDKIWRNLQQAINTPPSAGQQQSVRQVQADAGHREIVTPISQLDAIHTELIKTGDEARETKIKTLIAAAQSESRDEARLAAAQSKMYDNDEVLARTQIIKM